MVYKKGDTIKFEPNRCSQCGVCVGVCPQNAVGCGLSDDKGIYIIEIDNKKCTLCGLCVSICPAHYLLSDLIDETVLEKAEKVFLGYSKDSDMRFHSSTGGVTRTLIKTLLDNNIIDAAYTLNDKEGDFSAVCGEFIEKGQFVSKNVPNSLYKPVLWGRNLGRLNKNWKNILLVGLPCQVKAAKKYFSKVTPNLALITIAILCRQNQSLVYSKYIRHHVKHISDEKRIVYRGNGWPGEFIGHKYVSFGWGFWKLGGCYYCVDCLAANCADITVADPWHLVDAKDDNCGTNLIYCWNKKRTSLLSDSNNNIVVEREIDRKNALLALEYPSIKNKHRELCLLLDKKPSRVERVRCFLKSLIRFWYKKLLFTNIIKLKIVKSFFFGFYRKVYAKL